VNQIMFTIEAG